MTTDPFKRYPLFLAQLPRIVRLFILHGLIGFGISAVFTALILCMNVANIGHLVTTVSGGWLATAVFFVLNGIVFGGVQTGIIVMSLGRDDDQGGGLRGHASPTPHWLRSGSGGTAQNSHVAMKWPMQSYEIQTRGQGLYEFTQHVRTNAAGTGLLTLFIRHTSASLLIQENADPEVKDDLSAFFGRLVPPTSDPSMSYLTHTYEGPDDMPAHIKAALLPTHLSIPVSEGQLMLGTWQGIYLFEHRDAPQVRNVVGHFASV